MKDNQVYYLSIGRGTWHGLFSFEITSLGGFWAARGPTLTEKLVALGLHCTFKILPKATINSRIDGTPGALRAKSHAWVVMTMAPIARLSPLPIYLLRGRYFLREDGSSVDVRMHEGYGPLPLLFQRDVRATAQVTGGGTRAEYHLDMFGSPWTGVYEIAEGQEHLDVRYTCTWGTLTYNADKQPGSATSGAPAAVDVSDVLAIARRLDEKADTLRAAGDLLAVFTEVYADITYAVAEALAEGGVTITGPHVERRYFRDPAWIIELTRAFAGRYFAAVEALEGDRYVPPWWRPVFDALRVRRMTALDALGLCIYAHIAGDLPHAVAEVHPFATNAEQRLCDYDLVGIVLAHEIEDASDLLADDFGLLYGWLDALAGRLKEVLVTPEIRELRAVAWYQASRLAALAPEAVRDAERSIRTSVEDFVSDLLDPEPPPLAVAAQLTRNALAKLRTW